MQIAMHPKERFAGRWLLYRHVFDLDSQWLGRFEGHADLEPTDDGLSYFEVGKLQFGGLTAIDATRRYYWHFPSEGRVDVTFEDGSAFHHFDPDQSRSEASHFCDPDTYEVTYDFSGWPVWRVEWRVEGPLKDYRLVSVYSPEQPREISQPVLDRLVGFFTEERAARK